MLKDCLAMNKFNWAILGDPHWVVRGDSKIFHELFASFYTKLLADMEANGTKTLIILGDVFERRKFVNFETLHVCKREFFDKALAAGITMGLSDTYQHCTSAFGIAHIGSMNFDVE